MQAKKKGKCVLKKVPLCFFMNYSYSYFLHKQDKRCFEQYFGSCNECDRCRFQPTGVRASDSRPEGLGSMPPNNLRVHTEYVLIKLVCLKVLWVVAAEIKGAEEYLPPLQFHA
ncbi:hypothetical protein TNCV_2337381 [Trichonephila clavipes]|nr:hypothetical protein TNCV_2337381 [Trichonephila clavipes]